MWRYNTERERRDRKKTRQWPNVYINTLGMIVNYTANDILTRKLAIPSKTV